MGHTYGSPMRFSRPPDLRLCGCEPPGSASVDVCSCARIATIYTMPRYHLYLMMSPSLLISPSARTDEARVGRHRRAAPGTWVGRDVGVLDSFVRERHVA